MKVSEEMGTTIATILHYKNEAINWATIMGLLQLRNLIYLVDQLICKRRLINDVTITNIVTLHSQEMHRTELVGPSVDYFTQNLMCMCMFTY